MSVFFIPFVFAILLIAAVLREDSILALVYLLVGAVVLSRVWSREALRAVSSSRTFSPRAFLGETVPVTLVLKNKSWLPVIWLQVRESLPVGLAYPSLFQRVVALPPKGQQKFEYVMEARRRGYYPVGPLNLFSGDVFGIAKGGTVRVDPQYLTVYPKIVPLSRVSLPTRSPLGTLRHTQPLFEDPARMRGKRDYIVGDSLRRVDWKSTASSGRLQVKQYEPSIALETAIFLNLNADEYLLRDRFDTPELGVVIAASLANWVTGQRQPVGLYTNGIDPLADQRIPLPIPAGRGRHHLMRILEVLARIEAGQTLSFVQLLEREVVNLAWGTTLLLITARADEALFDVLYQSHRAGLSVMLVLIGQVVGYQEIQRQAGYFGYHLYHIQRERDLDIWRQ